MIFVVALACVGMLYYLYCILTVDETGSTNPTKLDLLIASLLAGVLRPFLWLWEKIHD